MSTLPVVSMGVYNKLAHILKRLFWLPAGILIESIQGPIWIYDTISEHTVLYQYMVYGAKNVFMGMIQTESPYYLPNPQAPAPFTSALGLYNGDPDFKDCSAS